MLNWSVGFFSENKRAISFGGLLYKYFFGLRPGLPYHNGYARLDDAGFFPGYFREGIPQQILVIV